MAYDSDNIFAKILRGEAPAHQVYEDDHTVAFLDVMPQADGHTLVLPKTPAENIFSLDAAALGPLMRTVQLVARGVREAFPADGIRISQLNGAAAGQTVFHLHVHIIPCLEGKPRRPHATSLADNALLADHATRLKTALARLAESTR
jgi:histidine triad (HIT) family protein